MSDSRDRETVVVSNDGGSSLGMILGILLVIALLVAVWFFTLGPGRGTSTNSGGNSQPLPSVQVPAASQAPAAS